MIPSNEKDRRRILFASVFEADCKDSPYFEDALVEVTKEYIKYNLKTHPRDIIPFCLKGFPSLPKREFIIVCAILVVSWEIDDIIDDPRHIMKLRIHQLESARSAFTSGKIEPYMSTTDCLLHHIDKIKCGYLKDRLKHAYLSYIDLVQKNINLDKRDMSPDDYIKYRRIEALGDFTYMLMFIDVDDFRPYYNYFQSETGNEMTRLASEIGIIHNDIVSLKKDIKKGETSNSVFIWMKTYDMTEDEAIDALALKAKEEFKQLVLMRDTALDPIGNDILQKIIVETSGNLFWSIQSPRYC